MNSSFDMKVDMIGRLNKLRVKKHEYLLPLFEAVVNSFQSLEECDNVEKTIRIILQRDKSQIDIEQKEYDQYPFENYVIEDNGVGFNNKNFDSFLTSDSTYKAKKGGKGVGRFIWLKVFKNTNIESTYKQENDCYLRGFDFNIHGDSFVKNHNLSKIDAGISLTRVSLLDIKKEYKENIPKDLHKIAKSIIYHCLDYFLSNNKINVFLTDEVTTINLTDYVNENIKNNIHVEDIKIEDNEFKLKHIKLYDFNYDKNKIHYCANDREVMPKNISSISNVIPDTLVDSNDKEFTYECYVSSLYLDNNVNDERTGFYIEQNDRTIYSNLSFKVIEEDIIENIKNYLDDYIKSVNEEKIKSIVNFINTEQPSYKPLLKYKKEELINIPAGLNKEKLDMSLYKLTQELNSEIKKESVKFKNIDINDISNLEEYKVQLSQYLEKTNDLSKSSLAEYIIHRKVILDLLKNGLKMKDNEKYSKEEYIHNLIFPMKSTSEDIDYNKHNLWIIDEKLSYHYYLSSDLSFKSMNAVDVDSNKRPDLFIIDNPIAVVDTDEKPYNSVVIFEFKRPGRDNYKDDLDPVEQLYNYVRLIKSNKAKDKDGLDIFVGENTMFYLYLLCSRSEEIANMMIKYDFTPFPDRQGFYYFNKGLNAYIEVIYYDKVENDARKRNKILFDKLFSPQID